MDDSILDARNMRKTKIVATLGPTSNTQEAIIEMGDKGVNVCRLNMSHGDHSSHQEVVDKIKYYNSLDRGCLAILLDTKVRHATLPHLQSATIKLLLSLPCFVKSQCVGSDLPSVSSTYHLVAERCEG